MLDTYLLLVPLVFKKSLDGDELHRSFFNKLLISILHGLAQMIT